MLKNFTEITQVVKAAVVGSPCNRHTLDRHFMAGVINPQFIDIIHNCFTRIFLEDAAEIFSAEQAIHQQFIAGRRLFDNTEQLMTDGG